MSDDAAIRRENFRRLWGAEWSPSRAVLALGKTTSFWSDLYHGRKSFGEKLAREIEGKLNLTRLSLDEPLTAGVYTPPSARPRDLNNAEDAPHVLWGDLMTNESPLFWVSLPDDAMAPRAPAGKMICFDRRETARAGDGVLVRDRDGALYFRLYRAAAGGRWTAAALNPSFEPLDSERDGLQVVAVLKAEEGRWG